MSLREFTSTDMFGESSTGEDATTVTHNRDGHLVVELGESLLQHINQLATQRYKSSGGTHTKRDNSRSERQIHLDGLKAEAALAEAYDEAELDEEIYHGSGDGGVDTKLRLDGKLVSVDVKCTSHEPPWIKVEAGAVESKTEAERCDAYVAAVVDGKTVEFYGWLPSEEVIDTKYKRQAYARHCVHQNYTREGGYNNMPRMTKTCNTKFSFCSDKQTEA